MTTNGNNNVFLGGTGRMGKWLTAAIAVLGALSLASGASAGQDGWKPASGTLTSFIVPHSIVQQGANTLITFSGGGSFAGTLSGPVGIDPGGTWLIHPDGSSVAIATGVASAAIGDCGAVPGGVRYRTVLFGQAQPDGSTTFSGVAFALGPQAANNWINVSGVIPAGGFSATSTYSGQYSCR
jgi:hypothetical protein